MSESVTHTCIRFRCVGQFHCQCISFLFCLAYAMVIWLFVALIICWLHLPVASPPMQFPPGECVECFCCCCCCFQLPFKLSHIRTHSHYTCITNIHTCADTRARCARLDRISLVHTDAWSAPAPSPRRLTCVLR